MSNPVPSDQLVDFKSNAESADRIVNGEQDVTTRTGKVIKAIGPLVDEVDTRRGQAIGTIDGYVSAVDSARGSAITSINQAESDVQQELQDAIARTGYNFIGEFTDGGTIESRADALRFEGEWYRWDGTLPKTVPAGSTPQDEGGIGSGAWLSVGDAALRSNLLNEGAENGVGVIRRSSINIPTVEDLRNNLALNVFRDNSVCLEGYFTRGDGGGGSLIMDVNDTETADDGVFCFVGVDGTRYKRPQTSVIPVAWGGVFSAIKGENVANCAPAIQNLIDAAPTNSELIFPSGRFRNTESIKVGKAVTLVGVDHSSFYPRTAFDFRGEGVFLDGLEDSNCFTSLKNLRIIATSEATNSTGFKCNQLNRGIIDNVRFEGWDVGAESEFSFSCEFYNIWFAECVTGWKPGLLNDSPVIGGRASGCELAFDLRPDSGRSVGIYAYTFEGNDVAIASSCRQLNLYSPYFEDNGLNIDAFPRTGFPRGNGSTINVYGGSMSIEEGSPCGVRLRRGPTSEFAEVNIFSMAFNERSEGSADAIFNVVITDGGGGARPRYSVQNITWWGSNRLPLTRPSDTYDYIYERSSDSAGEFIESLSQGVFYGNPEDPSAHGTNSFYFGRLGSAKGTGSVSIGRDSHSDGNDSIAIGRGAESPANNAFAIGLNAETTDGDGALGRDAKCLHVNSISLGRSTETQRGNTACIGNRDFESTRTNGSVILRSPNGTPWRIRVDDSGDLTVTAV